jgi:two-component system, NarL family, nitrate/nitrite response regulator NarL
MTPAPRVLIADDHPPTRAGVRIALERDGFEVCAEAWTAEGAVEAAVRENPDVCLLDINMPGGGASAASTITARLPHTVVLMLTVSREGEDLLESMRRGAHGYLLKEMDPQELPVLVRGALAGDAPLPRQISGFLIDELRHEPPHRHPPVPEPGRPELTRREWEVLDLLCEGAGTGDIAERLFLSQVTVRRHISAILGKLGVSSREEAIRLTVEAGRARR